MHERAPVTMEAAKLIKELAGTGTVPSEVTVEIAPDVIEATASDAWSSATHGTMLENASVTWRVRLPGLVCLTCETEYRGTKLDRCPKCSGDGLIVDDVPVAKVVSWAD